MPESRLIEFNINAVELSEFRQATDPDKLENAIGYLITWNPSFGFMTLHVTDMGKRSQPEMLACYWLDKEERDAGGAARYAIGAVWHDDHFGFHS